jgi:hypothetical protein
MDGNQFFGAANPPAPPSIAVLQILFQMGCIVGVLLTLNYMIEGFSECGLGFLFPWMAKEEVDKRVRRTELDLMTQNLLHANKHNIVIVAMNERATGKCLGLCSQYKNDRLVFCQLHKSVSDSSNQVSEVTEVLSEVDKFDIVAISDGGEEWCGLNISEAERIKELSKIMQLRDCVVDCWLMRLVVGNGSWISAKEVEMPIKYPEVSKL